MSEEESLIEAARAAELSGEFDKVEILGRQALRQAPRSVGARVFLAGFYARQGHVQQAVQLYQEALRIDPKAVEAYNGFGILLYQLQDYREATAASRQMIALAPEDPRGYNNLGLCLFSQQKLAESAEAFRKAISLNPEDPNQHFNLAQALQMHGRFGDAAQAYRDAIRLAPELSETYLRLGQLLLTQGELDEALSCVRKVLEIDPQSGEAHMIWAEVLLQQKLPDEAEKHLQTAATIDPTSASQQGFKLQVLGRFHEAEAAFARALEGNSSQGAPYYGLVRGKKITEADRPLVEKMQSALKRGGTTSEDQYYLHYSLGKAFDDLKEYDRAIRHFDEANALARANLRLNFDAKAFTAFTDHTIRTFTKSLFRRMEDVGVNDQTPIFVIGMIRSGTTFLEQVLSTHPMVGGGGELRYWYERQEELFRKLQTERFDGEYAHVVADGFLELLHALAPDKPHVIDKMPMNFMLLGFIHLVFPDAKIIHCKRNAVDNALSIYMTHFGVPPPYGHDRDNIVVAYQQYEKLMKHWKEVIPDEVFYEMQYEDLVSDYENQVREVVDFLGLPWSDECLHPERNERAVRTPSLWQVRQPAYKGSVARWRNYEPWLGSFRRLLKSG